MQPDRLPDRLSDTQAGPFAGDTAALRALRERSWQRHGKRLSCYLPGMFVLNGQKGLYPAFSLTGSQCAQHCAHCRGALLAGMPDTRDPQRLLDLCRRLEAGGGLGVLLTGGCDGQGALPWQLFLETIARIKATTSLHVSVHCGMIDRETALGLKQAGVDQALIDIIGAPETYREVYGLPDGERQLRTSLDALAHAGLPMVPHIVAGLHFGRLLGEDRALQLVADYRPKMLVVVSLMPLAGTRMAHVRLPAVEEVAGLLMRARQMLPDTLLSLGCARPRRTSAELERLALLCGVNRMALPCEETLELAQALGLQIVWSPTCCSVAPGPETDHAPQLSGACA